MIKHTLVFLSLALLLSCPCYGESDPIVISIEIVELDCTAFPDRFDEYCKLIKSKNEEDSQKAENMLNKFEKVVPKKTVLQHSQNTRVGDKVDQTTQFNGSKFILKLLTEEGKKDLIHTKLDFAISEGEKKQRAINTTISVKLGESVSLGGMSSTTIVGKSDGTEEVTKCILIIRFKIEKNG